jgi:uncharacterized protein YjiS (DUF1127 family)
MISLIIGSARLVLAAGGALGRLGIGIGRWLRSQQDYRLLCEMPERELRDIGLRGSDLRDASAAPYFADPTAIIAIRASERRRGLAGGESVDEAMRALRPEAPCRPEQIAKESDSGEPGRVVFLRAAE